MRGGGGGRRRCGWGERGGSELKKGPWTPEEDAILIKYVMENGERNWNDLERKHGLKRCGQSCRRRWFNNLISDRKKEELTLEEERKIFSLHAQLGNKWAEIATHIPGRTDNDIKNFWHVRLRRHICRGLPLYLPYKRKKNSQRTQQQQQILQNHFQIPSLASPNQENPNLSSIASAYKNQENPNVNFIWLSTSSSHQPNLASFSSSVNQESLNVIPRDPNHSLLIAPLCHPESIMEFRPKRQNNAAMPPPPTVIPPSSNSAYISNFDHTQIASFDKNPFPEKNGTAFLSGNVGPEIPSIQSTFPETTPFSSNLIHQENYNVVSEICSERNNGMLEDVLRQSTALYNSRLPSKEDVRSKVDQPRGVIMHGDYLNNNVNVELIFGQFGNSETASMDEGSSLNMGVQSRAQQFEALNKIENDLWKWLGYNPSGPTEHINVSNGTMAANTNYSQQKVASNQDDHTITTTTNYNQLLASNFAEHTMSATTNYNNQVATNPAEHTMDATKNNQLFATNPVVHIIAGNTYNQVQQFATNPTEDTMAATTNNQEQFATNLSEYTIAATTNNQQQFAIKPSAEHTMTGTTNYNQQVATKPPEHIVAATTNYNKQAATNPPEHTMVATTNNQQQSVTNPTEPDHDWVVEMLSPIATTLVEPDRDWVAELLPPIATIPAEPDRDWVAEMLSPIDTTLVEPNHDWVAEMLSPIATIPADTDHEWAQHVMGSPVPFSPFELDNDEQALG